MRNKEHFVVFLYMFVGCFQLSQSQDRTFILSRQSFATNFYKNVTTLESCIVSPASVDFALSALFFGSSQQTYLELMTGLHYPKNYSMNTIQNNFMLMYRNLKKVGGLEIATKIFVNKTLLPQPSYKTTIIRVLNADIEQVNFAQNIEAAERINGYVAEKTQNMITEVIDADGIDAGTTMILVNCIYFKGEWLYTFNKSRTFTSGFFIDETNKVPVDFMTIKTKFSFGYIQELNSLAVSLPYKNSDMTMLLILPKNKTSLPYVISKVSNYDWSTIDQEMRMSSVNVTMPKFNITFDSHIDGILKKMGMNDIFDSKKSCLDRILSSPMKGTNLYVDTVIHKAIIKVDEEGTVAAAVTVILSRSVEPTLLFNYPFLFMLRAGPTILFIGQFTGNRPPSFSDPDDWKKYPISDGDIQKLFSFKVVVLFLDFLYIFTEFLTYLMAQDRIFLLSRQSFATDLFKNLSKPESFVIAPGSIDFAISALFFGSSQQAFLEMMTGLHFPKNYSMNMIQNNFMLLNKNLKNVKGLEIATKLYINMTMAFQLSYKMAIERVLNAEIELISFAQNVQAAHRINSYIAEKTHNMIKNVISSDSINSETSMILLNCIYFKGSWLYKFPKHKTYTGQFYIDETNTVSVQYMTQKADFMFGYIEKLGWAQTVSLPYKDSDMTMLFILPRYKYGLPDLVNNMTNYDWSTIDQQMWLSEVIVKIPKFNVSFDQQIDKTLKNMGFQMIFEPNKANLDRILISPNKNTKLYVDALVHKAVMRVDEDGTEAAAVSMIMTRSAEMEFTADHPFLFMLRAKSSILFIGQYTGDMSKPFINAAQFQTTNIPDSILNGI
ncbi:uncharacterized protein [Chironomus tepperi]|uniref:uncharacterized protein n=1 Tax=Chironomus tepperi TaxID=113505 RepID=UPI00391F1379